VSKKKAAGIPGTVVPRTIGLRGDLSVDKATGTFTLKLNIPLTSTSFRCEKKPQKRRASSSSTKQEFAWG
jgi:hypothetical protein